MELCIAGDFRGNVLIWDGKAAETLAPKALVTLAR